MPVSQFLLTRPSRDVTGCAVFQSVQDGFLLTRPSRDVTGQSYRPADTLKFLLTRPSRDVTRRTVTLTSASTFLLTRPSRDVTPSRKLSYQNCKISTHTSLAGRDGHGRIQRRGHGRFLLTRPSRDVTAAESPTVPEYTDFYSHVPRGT